MGARREIAYAFEAYRDRPMGRCIVITIVALVLLFVLFPAFHIKPYQLHAENMTEVVEVQPDVIVPPPPREVPRPPVTITPAGDESGLDDIPPTTFGNIDDFPPQPAPGPSTNIPFVPFEELPHMIEYVKPTYPALAQQAGIEGVVHVLVIVGTDGKPEAVSIQDSEVTPAMDQAALAAARKCRFTPAKQRTTPVRAPVIVTYVFRLD